MNEQLLLLKSGLMAHFYYWTELSRVSAVNVVAPGVPNYPDKDFFNGAPELLRNEAFMVVYYPGYWFSSGRLSSKDASESLRDAVRGIFNGEWRDSFTDKLLPNIKVPLRLIGYSYGANPVARAAIAQTSPGIERVLLVAPLLCVHETELGYMPADISNKFNSFNRDFARFLDRGYSNLIHPADPEYFHRYLAGTDRDSVIGNLNRIAQKTYIIYGADDASIPFGTIARASEQIPSDHTISVAGAGHDKHLIYDALQSVISSY